MLEREHPELMHGTGSSAVAGAYTCKRYQPEIAATVARLARRHGTGGGQRTGEDERRPLSNPILEQPTFDVTIVDAHRQPRKTRPARERKE